MPLIKVLYVVMAADVPAHDSFGMHHGQGAFQAHFIRLIYVNGHMGTGAFLRSLAGEL